MSARFGWSRSIAPPTRRSGACLQSVAPKLGCTAETLRKWVRQAQRDAGYRPGLTTSERERLKELEREVRELKRAKRDPAEGVRVFCPGGARPPREVMVRFIHDHRDQYGVEPICTVLPIAPSTYHRHRAAQVDPTRRSARAQRDDALRPEIQRVYDEHHQVYWPRKVWKQLRREGFCVARCTVGRLMRAMGWKARCVGARGSRPRTRAMAAGPQISSIASSWRPVRISSGSQTSPTWRPGVGSPYVAFVIDVFARRIVGWRVSASMRTDFVLDALEQAIYARRGDALTGLVHHSDRGTQYLSMRYTDRLAAAGIAPSGGSQGDAFDNALAESVIGLYRRR